MKDNLYSLISMLQLGRLVAGQFGKRSRAGIPNDGVLAAVSVLCSTGYTAVALCSCGSDYIARDIIRGLEGEPDLLSAILTCSSAQHLLTMPPCGQQRLYVLQ